MLDIQPMFDIRRTFKKKPTPDITLSVLCNWKKPPYALTPKDSDKQLFFIVNDGKASRCHPRFINSRAGRGYPHSINRSASRCHLYSTIKEAMCRWLS